MGPIDEDAARVSTPRLSRPPNEKGVTRYRPVYTHTLPAARAQSAPVPQPEIDGIPVC